MATEAAVCEVELGSHLDLLHHFPRGPFSAFATPVALVSGRMLAQVLRTRVLMSWRPPLSRLCLSSPFSALRPVCLVARVPPLHLTLHVPLSHHQPHAPNTQNARLKESHDPDLAFNRGALQPSHLPNSVQPRSLSTPTTTCLQNQH